jgi:DNA-binding IclR family transcriptional regulator
VERRPAPKPLVNGYTTVRKAMAVISAFSYQEPVLGVSELSRRLGMGKSTVHRLLNTLVADGFVERTADERYRLSLRLYEIGQQVVAGLELREVSHTPLERLRNASGETSHLAVLAVPDVVYLDRFESPSTLRMFTRFGRRTPAHATSSGKCLLAYGAAADLDVVVQAGLPRLGPRTITGRTMFHRTLSEVRKRGYAVSIEESERGVVSVGAPIFDHSGDCVAAVSVAGPIMRMPPGDLDRFVRLVVGTASEVSTAMGSSARPQGG